MYKRLERNITIYHLRDSVDDYGQPRLEWDSKVESKGSFYLTSQMNATNPDFLDVDAVLVLRENYLDSHYILEIDDQKYRIKYSLPVRPVRSRYTQYLLADTNESPEEFIENGVFWKLSNDTSLTDTEGALHLHLRGTSDEGYELARFETSETLPPWTDDVFNIYEVSFETEIQPTTLYRWFDASNVIHINNLDKLDLTKCVSLQWTFRDCHNLIDDIQFSTGAPLNTSLRSTFKNCNLVKSIDVTGLCSSACTSLNSLFHSCYELRKITGLDTFDTSNVTEFTCLFNFCYYLTRVDGIENWNTSSATKMNGVFYSCRSLPFIHIPTWTFTNVDTVANMFRDCQQVGSIDIENFTPSSVLTTMSRMFDDCKELVTINCKDIYCNYPTGCVVSNVFRNCWLLPGWGLGTSADYWIDNVRYIENGYCPPITFDGITNATLKFSFTRTSTGDYYSNALIPDWIQPGLQPVQWKSTTTGQLTEIIQSSWSLYRDMSNDYQPFRAVIKRPNYLCSYCDIDYSIDGNVQIGVNFAVDISGTVVTFTSLSSPLEEGEWFAYSLYKDGEQVMGHSNMYCPAEFFTLYIGNPGDYQLRVRRCKHHYNPTENWIDFTVTGE